MSLVSRFASSICHHQGRRWARQCHWSLATSSNAGAVMSANTTTTYAVSPPNVLLLRSLSSSGPTDDNMPDYSSLQRLEDANPDRIRGIQVNPDSLGSQILPGNLVYKKYKWSGNTRKVPLELVHGYFWMMWDLQNTDSKPTLSNEEIISEEDAQLFPVLNGLKTLSGRSGDLPFIFERDEPHCTLVAISFRDSGYKNIPTWTEPFTRAFFGNSNNHHSSSNNVDVMKISITERSSLYYLQGALTRMMKANTPEDEHDSTWVYFGSDVDDFRDVLRMHNIMTNYTFLVDQYGCIRFAGSGPATDEEVARTINFAKEIAGINDNTDNNKRNKSKKRSNYSNNNNKRQRKQQQR